MTACQSCDRKCDVFLCSTCQSKLRELLEHLPWWIAHLEDAAVGHVRLGDGGGGRTTARREPFKGDDEALARCTCHHAEHEGRDCGAVDREVTTTTDLGTNDDGELVEIETQEVIAKPCHCVEYQPVANQAKLRAQFLAAGRINVRAADELHKVRNTITTWVRHIGETRGITFVRPSFIGPLQAGHVRMSAKRPAMMLEFLTENVAAIACDEAAGELLATFQDHVAAIEKVINRPVPMRYLGKCPTWNERTRKACATQLQCREGDVQVVCPTCRQTHDPNRLQLLMMNDLEREKLTIKQILGLKLPEEYQINERSLRRWRKPGKKGEPPKLKACGYRRGGEDGPLVINRHSEDDEPVYRWADVRKLRAERVDSKVKTA